MMQRNGLALEDKVVDITQAEQNKEKKNWNDSLEV